MNIYAVGSGAPGDYAILALFSSREKAQAYIDKGMGEDIDVYELDPDDTETIAE